MPGSKKKYIAFGSWTLLILLIGYLGYSLYTLNAAHTAQTKELEKMSHRADLLHQKYTAQKAQTAAAQRAKLMVEGMKRQAEMEAEKLAGELEALKSAKSETAKEINALEARIDDLNGLIENWKKRHGEISEKYDQAKETIADRDNTIISLNDNIAELASELQFAQRTQDRYLKHNQNMATTAQSILARYDEKGAFSNTLLDVEPFTQIKKVELEKMIQEYLDQVDDQVIRE
ncbi:MAG: hypothetical protein KJP07_14250 [Desulfatitalea sp.]|nr:hypothetical protein [Desulfatitalea sp.]